MSVPAETALPPDPGPARGRKGFDTALLWCWLPPAVLAPVWFGSNTPLLWAAHAVIFGFVFAAYGARQMATREGLPVPLHRLAVPLAALAIVLGWAAIQTLPWVPGAWRHPLWAMLPPILLRDVPGTISVYPEAGRVAMLWTATAAAAFLLALQSGRDPRRARLVLDAVTLSGGAVALYGLAVYATGNQIVAWQPKLAFVPPGHPYLKRLSATFVDPDTCATYAGLIAVCGLGLAAERMLRRRDMPTAGGSRIARLRSAAVFAIVFLAAVAALVLTGSRGGIAATALGLATLTALLVVRLAGWRRLGPAAVMLGGLGILVFAIGHSGPLLGRLGGVGPDFDSRLALDARVVAAIRASPWQGYGYGAFEPAFAMFRDLALPAQSRIEYAHNDWLEALMTLGIPVGAMLWLIFAWVLARCLVGALRRGGESAYPAIGAAAWVLAASHSLVDFSLQVQGFALPLLAVLGVAVAHSWPPDRRPG